MENKDVDLKVYKSIGELKNILITIHGFAGDKESSVIDAVAREMNNYNYEVISFDLPCQKKNQKIWDMEENFLLIINFIMI